MATREPASDPEPTWGKSEVSLRVAGMAAQKATRVHVALPDGSQASKKAAAELSVWPALRLRVVFDEYSLWWGSHGTPWHEAAVAAVMELCALTKPAWIVQDTVDRLDNPVLAPAPYAADLARKYVARTLFATKPPAPWTVVRSGAALSVQYENNLLVLRNSVELFLPPTPANAALLERTLDALATRLSFAWAGVGYGLAGHASSLALGGPPPEKLERKQPAMDADWLVWLGDRGRASVAQSALLEPLERGASRSVTRGEQRARISAPRPLSLTDRDGASSARALRVELGEVASKRNALARREALRRPAPGKAR